MFLLLYFLFNINGQSLKCDSIKSRVPCGYLNISLVDCVDRGCCWDSSAGTKSQDICFYLGDGVPIKKVHVIQSNHFDAGYACDVACVLNMYFDKFIPRAWELGKNLTQLGGPEQLKWITQGWIVSLYVDCLPALGLHCPSETALKQFEEAVSNGWIRWHAFPHNAQLSVMDESMVEFGVDLVHDLDKRFGVPPKRVLSQRDVPGLPRPVLPVLQRKGVEMISVGSNARINYPNVAPMSIWRDKEADKWKAPKNAENLLPDVSRASGAELLLLWHGYGYGSMGQGHPVTTDYVQVPGFDEVLFYLWRGDNSGPPESVEEVQNDWKTVAKYFPDAEIFASTFEDFVDAYKDSDKSFDLPVVTEDLEDSWLMGVASDPLKYSRLRILQQVRSDCLASKGDGCAGANAASFYNASRFILKNGEHTWGEKYSYLGRDLYTGYDNDLFHANVTDGKYTVSKSWVDQRKFGIDTPLKILEEASNPLAETIEQRFEDAILKVPDVTNWTRVKELNQVFQKVAGWVDISFDQTGAIATLYDHKTSTNWASKNNTLGLYRYQVVTLEDYSAYQSVYLRANTGGQQEYGKPGSDEVQPERQLTPGVLTNLWRSPDEKIFAAEISMPQELHTKYGAPSKVWHIVEVENSIDQRLILVNKVSTRIGEAMYFGFNPERADLSNSNVWFMDKLGEWVSPLDVRNGSGKGLQGVSTGLLFSPDEGKSYLRILSQDAGMVRWDKPLPFPTPIRGDVNLDYGANFVLSDNTWNTNYPFWYGFKLSDDDLGIETNMSYSFKLLTGDLQ